MEQPKKTNIKITVLCCVVLCCVVCAYGDWILIVQRTNGYLFHSGDVFSQLLLCVYLLHCFLSYRYRRETRRTNERSEWISPTSMNHSNVARWPLCHEVLFPILDRKNTHTHKYTIRRCRIPTAMIVWMLFIQQIKRSSSFLLKKRRYQGEPILSWSSLEGSWFKW